MVRAFTQPAKGRVSDPHRDTHYLDIRSMVQIETASSLFSAATPPAAKATGDRAYA